jgi:ectoine hydroxylase
VSDEHFRRAAIMRGMMELTREQLKQYEDNGFLVLSDVFDAAEVAELNGGYSEDLRIDGPHVVAEEGAVTGGAVYAAHLRHRTFATLVRSATLLGPVHQLLKCDEVYVYQFKINVKSGLGNNKVDWHQDYPAWKIADRLPAPTLVNAAVLLDDSTEYNGPLYFIPGSHRAGLTPGLRRDGEAPGQHFDPADIALGPRELTGLIAERGIRSVQAPAGSVVFFHPEIVHSSPTNMSPLDRRLLIITYNHRLNLPTTQRPEYIVGRDTGALAADTMEVAR